MKDAGKDLAERLLNFAVEIIKLVNTLPKTEVGIHIRRQLLKSGTSAGANYEEARGAESRSDFCHKLGYVKLLPRVLLLRERFRGGGRGGINEK